MSHTIGVPHSKDIVVEGNPVLREVAAAVTKEQFGTPALKKVLAKMIKALREEPYGVAIAAPQIGVALRIFVIRGYLMANIGRHDEGANDIPDKVFINPTIVRQSKKKVLIEGEGCLSVPHVYGDVKRSLKVTVRAQDETGKKFERGGADVLAEAFEHEIDHLNGILFIDHAKNIRSKIHEE